MTELMGARRGQVLLLIGLSLTAALFEGSTMGVLAVALQVVTADGLPELGAEFGRLGGRIDALVGSWSEQRLFVSLVLLAALGQVLRSASSLGSQLVTAKLVSGLEASARRMVFGQMVSINYPDVRKKQAGDLASFTNEVTHLGAAVIEMSNLVMQLSLMAAYSVVLLWLSWKLTLAALAAGLLIALSIRGLTRKIVDLAETYKQSIVGLNALVVEFLNGLGVIRTYAREDHAVARVDDEINRAARSRRAVLSWQATLSPFVDVVTILGLSGLLLAGYFLVGDARLALAAKMATFLIVLYRLIPRISILNKNWGRIVGRLPFIERIAGWVRRDDKIYPEEGSVTFDKLHDGVRFEGVGFTYPDASQPAVTGLTFSIPAGGMVALVGESGSGKSTTASLLLRFYEAGEGRILVDDTDLRDLDWTSWRQRVGVVSQDTFIFHASVRDNIAFSKDDSADEEIHRAARAARAEEFIAELPQGYETVLGEQGERLSGGQRQRISIARALLKDPELLILDEATSDLDSRAEKSIQDAIEELRGQRSVVAIAHRLSTVRGADEILVLDRGRIVERGTHEELLEKGGRYAALWELQAGSSAGREATE